MNVSETNAAPNLDRRDVYLNLLYKTSSLMARNHALSQINSGPLRRGQVLTSFEVMLICGPNGRMCHRDIGFIWAKLTVRRVSDNGGNPWTL